MCGLKTQTELTWRQLIDIGAVPTQTEHKLTGRWPIDIGATQKTQTETDKTMIDRYRRGLKNWTEKMNDGFI